MTTRIIASKLRFKGTNDSKITKKRKAESTDILNHEENISSMREDTQSSEIKILDGTGRITSSGTTVHGHENSRFMEQFSPGDAILITHPTSYREETKIIRMVLSNISMGISSAFSSDLITTTAFKFIKAPKEDTPTEDSEGTKKSTKKDVEEEAYGTYASQGGQKFTYRVKKPGAFGGYKIVTEDTGGSLSREELLNQRSKKKADRLCY